MKNFIFILTMLSVGFISNGQTSLSSTKGLSSNPQPRNSVTSTSNGLGDTANLQKEITELGTFEYTFQSDKILEPGKIDRWSMRLEQQFSQIIDLQLISSTQIVVVTLNGTHSEQDLLEIVQKFDYLNYSIGE